MAPPLTVRALDAVKPKSTRTEIPDGATPGLFLIVQPSGAMSWAFRFRAPMAFRLGVKGKRERVTRKLTIGPYPGLGLADARAAAKIAAAAVERGRDPIEDKKAAVEKAADQSDIINNLLDEFAKRHIDVNSKASTAIENKRLIDKMVRPAWGKRKIQSLSRRDVVALLDGIVDRGAAVSANRVFVLQLVG